MSECVLKTLACQGLRVSPSKTRSTEKLSLRAGTGWRAFFQFFSAALVHMISCRINKIIHTGVFAPIKIFGGTWCWYANFSSLKQLETKGDKRKAKKIDNKKAPEFGTCLGGKRLGARKRGRTATQRSKKGSEKVLGRVLIRGGVLRRGPAIGF